MKVLVISGFLGAGKTTFIQELLRRVHRDFAIMENEVGALGVDGELLQNTDKAEPVKIVELTEGCICCTRQADFASSVLTIANTADPEVLIVEPTGVGELSKIIANIKKIEYEKIELLAPLVIVDGKNFFDSLNEYPALCTDQIQNASTIIVSKTETQSESDKLQIEQKIRELNHSAEILTEHYGKQNAAWWNALTEKGFGGKLSNAPSESEKFETVSLTPVSLTNCTQLLLFLSGVVSGIFGNIVRAKGFVKIGKAGFQFSVVGGQYSVSGFDETTETKAVFIGKNLNRAFLREVLQKPLYAVKIPRSMQNALSITPKAHS